MHKCVYFLDDCDIIIPSNLQRGLPEEIMEIETAPDGWRFSTADFSLQAAGKSGWGR